MFFILSKTLALLLLPSNFLIGIGIVGVVLLLTRLRRAGTRLMIVSLVLLALAGFLPIGAVLEHALECRFPPWDPARGTPDGIIVLGGAIAPRLSRAHGLTQVTESAERILALLSERALRLFWRRRVLVRDRRPLDGQFVLAAR